MTGQAILMSLCQAAIKKCEWPKTGARLRDIELKVMQYQDELESGKQQTKPGWTISEQVEQFRKKIMKQTKDLMSDSNLSRTPRSSSGQVTTPRHMSGFAGDFDSDEGRNDSSSRTSRRGDSPSSERKSRNRGNKKRRRGRSSSNSSRSRSRSRSRDRSGRKNSESSSSRRGVAENTPGRNNSSIKRRDRNSDSESSSDYDDRGKGSSKRSKRSRSRSPSKKHKKKRR